MKKNKKKIDVVVDTTASTSTSDVAEETYQDILAQIDAEKEYNNDTNQVSDFTDDNPSVFDEYTKSFDEDNLDSEDVLIPDEATTSDSDIVENFLSPEDDINESSKDKKNEKAKKEKKEKVKKEKPKKEKPEKVEKEKEEKPRKNKEKKDKAKKDKAKKEKGKKEKIDIQAVKTTDDIPTETADLDITSTDVSNEVSVNVTTETTEIVHTEECNSKKKKKKEKVKKSENETKLLNSINTKIALTVFASVVVALVITFFVTMSGFRSGIDELVKSNMITSVKTYNTLLEDTILLTKDNLTTSTLTTLYKEAGLDGIETSQVALIDSEGIYTFHRKYQLIKKSVSSPEIMELVEEHKTNKKMEPSVIEITEDGVDKYVGYYPCDNGWLLICTAEKDELYSSYYSAQTTVIIGACIILVVLAALGFVVSLTITKPIKLLTEVIHKIATLDFTTNESLDKLCDGKDETAEMSKALKIMQTSIRDVIEQIHNSSELISANANNLTDIVNAVNEHSTDNSATTEELAAGMQEAAASTERVDSNISNIMASIDDISQKAKDGRQLAIDIMSKASKLKENTILASNNGKQMFENVRTETAIAIERSKDVEKINSLTKTILDISDETNLLSLNASIEAARAGDAGRGFAVVAEQIGLLANQSAATVVNIGEIVDDVRNAVNNMASCLETTLNFLEEKVLTDYNGFIEVSDEYNSDADIFEKSMIGIYNSITNLEKSAAQVADAISGITSTVGDASVGVSDIAEKTSEIVELTVQTNRMVNENVASANDLNNIVEVFKL